MTKSEMKVIVGGYADAGKCKTNCYKWNNSTGSMDSATCSAGTVVVNGTTLDTCDCSLAGATTCYNSPI